MAIKQKTVAQKLHILYLYAAFLLTIVGCVLVVSFHEKQPLIQKWQSQGQTLSSAESSFAIGVALICGLILAASLLLAISKSIKRVRHILFIILFFSAFGILKLLIAGPLDIISILFWFALVGFTYYVLNLMKSRRLT